MRATARAGPRMPSNLLLFDLGRESHPRRSWSSVAVHRAIRFGSVRTGTSETSTRRGEGDTMSNTDDAKGRIKEAAGDLTDDKDLKREGKVDQVSGKAKDKIDDVGDKAKDLVNRD